jgi:hypothetical protein
MADEPAHSLAEKSAAAAPRRGIEGFPGSPGGPGLPDHGLPRATGSYASCVCPNHAMPAPLFPSPASLPMVERR